jgi:hypothetical protein
LAMAKRPLTRRPAKQLPKTSSAAPLKEVRDEVAIRFKSGQEQNVRSVLSHFGTLDSLPNRRTLVLRIAPRVNPATVHVALDDLQSRGLVEFITPILIDAASGTRQVLTDEIVLRLKPGTSQRALRALKAAHGVEIQSANEFEPSQYIVKVPNPSGLRTLEVARSLDSCDDVEFASPNFLTQIKR